MPVIGVATYQPDQPGANGQTSARITNVLPRTAQSYGPWPGLSPLSSALTARCQGAYSMQDSAGNPNIFAGDATKLYRLQSGTTTFSDVSKVGGYTVGTSERWNMLLFGQRVIATDFADAPQSFVVGSSTVFADMIASGITSLKARYAAVVRDWVVFGNTTDGTFGTQPQRVWWSAINDPTNFPTPGTSGAAAVQSDYQDLVGDAGWVQGIVGNLGTADGAVFEERAIWRMVYAGPPAIFAFTVAEGARGTPAPGSIAQLGAVAYYLGEDGFKSFDGSNSGNIGFGKIDKDFFRDLDQSAFPLISSAVDPINELVFWGYPGAGHRAGSCNRLIVYSPPLDRWTITEAGVIEIEFLFRSLSLGYSIDTLDTVSSSIDALSDSLDSRIWTGGRPLLSAFDLSHKMNYFTGASLPPTVDTVEAQIFPGRRARVLRARPLVDGGSPSVAIGRRDRLLDVQTFDTAVAAQTDGSCPVRSDGRYLAGRITLPAGSSFQHISGLDLEEAVPVGTR